MATTTEKPAHMAKPAHPGEILRALYLEPLNVSITQAAAALNVTRKHVSAIVNERAPVSSDMALRLATVFATEPDIWINLQAQYDLWEISRAARPKVKPLRRPTEHAAV